MPKGRSNYYLDQSQLFQGGDVVRMLHYLYKIDPATYPNERQRVQQGISTLIHAFS